MAGRPKKPQSVKDLDGDKSRRTGKRTKAKPARTKEAPRQPNSLNKNAVGKAYWKHLVEILDLLGVLHKADRTVMELMCLTYSDMKTARKRWEKDGRYLVSKKTGNQYLHPAVNDEAGCLKRLQSQLDKLGLTPKARQNLDVEMPRLPVTPAQTDDGSVGSGSLVNFADSRDD